MTKREKYIIELIRDKIKEKDHSAEVILYGSHASGNAKKYSDWDILILLDKEYVDLKDEQVYRHLLLDLELEIGEPISVTVYSKKSWNTRHAITPLFRNISREGITIT
ncbi:MAG: nucleotidyltransferase domain-containing protein [Ignavibacteriales bacterium]|nr:MAG: nucleotidyltransferase domain-containing protein [Ignavibacteriales bacterium]